MPRLGTHDDGATEAAWETLVARTVRRVAVFGMGYVGIVSAACLASRGNSVIGVDVSAEKVAMVNDGRSPVVEERIGDLIAEQVAEGRLTRDDRLRERGGRHRHRAGVRRHAVGPEREPADQLPRAGQRGDRSGAGRPGGRYTVVIRSTMLPTTCEQIVLPRLEAASGMTRRRGLRSGGEPRVPARGQLGTRLLRPAQDGDRPDRRGERRRRRRALRGPAWPRLPRAAGRGRDDQVRRQQLPCTEGRLRERDRRGLQGAWARQPHRDGHPHRRHEAQHLAGVPSSGLRVRRLVPAQGPASHHPPRPAGRRARADPREHPPVQRGPDRPRLPHDRGHRQAPRGAARPRVQAGHGRPAREPDGRARRAPAGTRLRAA